VHGLFGLLAIGVVVAPLAAQKGDAAIIRVLDDRDTPVPYAVVLVANGRPVIADDSGRFFLRAAKGRPLELWVRRIGYREFRGPVAPVDGEPIEFRVRLPQMAGTLEATIIEAHRLTPLERTGFYGRAQRVVKGASVGEFISPEELEDRNPSKVSDMLFGRRSIRVVRAGPRRVPVILGRADCPMTIVLDGNRVNGSAQDSELIEKASPTSIPSKDGTSGVYKSPAGADQNAPGLDELVGAREVMAIEVYISLASAPAELIPLAGGSRCGLVAIWTGPRQ
jgi:hypothetical protein